MLLCGTCGVVCMCVRLAVPFLTSCPERACVWICVFACTTVCYNRSSLWIKAFYNPLSRHNSTSLTMDLCLLCLLIIVLIHMISCFMIPLALFLSRHTAATVMCNFGSVELQLFFFYSEMQLSVVTSQWAGGEFTAKHLEI